MNRRDIKLPREAKIQFRAIPETYGTTVEYRLEYRVDPDDQEHRYGEEKHSRLFGLIKWSTKIDYSQYWLNTHIFSGLCPEESETHYMNYSLGILIKNKNELNNYKDHYHTIEEFENHLINMSNHNYDNWKVKRERFLKESNSVLY